MHRIYLPLSTDLKLCSESELLMYLQSTSLTHGHSSPYLRPVTWVHTNGSKMICQPLGRLLGPESGAKVQPCFYASWFLGPISRYSDCGLASSLAFLIPTIQHSTCNLIAKPVRLQPLFQLLWVTLKTFCSSCWTLTSLQNYPLLAFLQDFPENWIFLKLTHKVQLHTYYVDIMCSIQMRYMYVVPHIDYKVFKHH